MPRRAASVTACVRSATPSLAAMFFMCPLVVFSDKPSVDATCLSAFPIATSRRIALAFAECFVDLVVRDFFGDFAGHVAMAAMDVDQLCCGRSKSLR